MYVMKPNFKYGYPFLKKLLPVEMGKTRIKMNQPVYLGRAILDLSNTLMLEFHCDYMQPMFGSKVNLCYMDTDSFLYEIEIHFYRDTDVETKFDTNRYSKNNNRPLPIGKIKKVIDMIKDELGGKIMTEFVALRGKINSCKNIDKKLEDKRCKGT